MIDPERIWSSDSLPTLPAVASQLLECSRNPETAISDVVAVIRTDPAISARILRAANSAYFGFKSRITSIERAVPLLGTNSVTALALSFSLVDDTLTGGSLAEHFLDYWRQSVVQACAAEVIGDRIEKGLGRDCFLSGLLMDIGRLAMLKTIPNDYRPALELARDSRRPLHEAEAELLGVDHVAVGLKLMQRWDLPAAVVDFAGAQLGSDDTLEGIVTGDSASLQAAAGVVASIGDYLCSTNNGPSLAQLRQVTSTNFGMSEDDLREFVDLVRRRLDEAAELFSVDVATLGNASDMLARANEHLAEIAVRAQVDSMQSRVQSDALAGENRQLEAQNLELRQRTVRDALTGLYNRSFLAEALRNEIERCRRTATPVAVVFSDIDHFKRLNDTYGHPFGDEVLVRVAETFVEVLRKSDVVARFGGEEFVALVLNPTQKSLERVAERLRARVESLPLDYEGFPVTTTVSIGAVWAVPGKREDDLAERLVAEADAAMYEAKRSGRNRVQIRSLLSDVELQVAKLVTGARFSRWLVREEILEIPALSRVLMQFAPPQEVIGKLAVRVGALDEDAVRHILEEQRSRPESRFGEIAHDLGLIDVESIGWLLAQQQEPCDALAGLLVEKGLLQPDRAAELRDRFLETAPFAQGALANA